MGLSIGELAPLWAKTDKKHDQAAPYHALICHLVDVAAVAEFLWASAVADGVKTDIARAFGFESPRVAGTWLTYLAGLHDLGKASPAFQRMNESRMSELVRFGWKFPAAIPAPHGFIGARAIRSLLIDRHGVGRSIATSLSDAIGGHHGIIPIRKDLDGIITACGEGRWVQAREDLATIMVRNLELGAPPTRANNAGLMWLAGFVSVVDWVGSNAEFFRFHDAGDAMLSSDAGFDQYVASARSSAAVALRQLGWMSIPRSGSLANYPMLGIETPNAMQVQVAEVAASLSGPSLVIIEAPMGEGKTEAALYLAGTIGAGSKPGMYFGLPSMATSNGMFGRLSAILGRVYGDDVIDLQLLHGNSDLSAQFKVLRDKAPTLLTPSDIASDDQKIPGTVIAAEWFTQRKKGLLSPFGVGTIDQSLLAALKTRHVFVRLFGLGGKTVILDEVHAYDTYMTELIERLLQWLAALGSSVILLSATLPASRRVKLLNAYRAGAVATAELPEPAPYPRVSWASATSSGSRNLPVSDRSRKALRLEWIDDDFDLDDGSATGDGLADMFRDALKLEGCGAVICNTVSRAQGTYRMLKASLPADWDIDLFHARYRFIERDRREGAALTKFGKPDDGKRTVARPKRSILVATQVIEQSLDLDFDLMVTDIAPIDLLLQRAGRLHRHDRGERGEPTLWIRRPIVTDCVPKFDRGTGYIYDQLVLLRTWLAIHSRERVTVPDDVEALIEFVYQESDADDRLREPALREALRFAREKADKRVEYEQQEASSRWLKSPTYCGELGGISADPGEDDSPELHRRLQAVTRLSDPSVTAIVLPVDVLPGIESRSAPPSHGVTIELMRNTVSLSHWGVVRPLLDQEAPKSWRDSALLRHTRVVRLDENRRARIGRVDLTDDLELGILIEKIEETEEGE